MMINFFPHISYCRDRQAAAAKRGYANYFLLTFVKPFLRQAFFPESGLVMARGHASSFSSLIVLSCCAIGSGSDKKG
jgi:hypothetical protein